MYFIVYKTIAYDLRVLSGGGRKTRVVAKNS